MKMLRNFHLFQPKESDLSVLQREDVMTATLSNLLLETTLFQQLNSELMQNAHAFHLELRLNEAIYKQVGDVPDRIFQKVLVPAGTLVKVHRKKDVLIFDKVDQYSNMYKRCQAIAAYDYLFRRVLLGGAVLGFIIGAIICVTMGAVRFGETFQEDALLLWNDPIGRTLSISFLGVMSVIVFNVLIAISVTACMHRRKKQQLKGAVVASDIFNSFTEVIDASGDI